MAFTKYDAARLYKKLRAREPNVSGALGVPPSGSAVGAIGDVVLATGAATTTDVLDARITATTFMELAPTDLYGSAEKGAGNIFWGSPADGIMRITHTASSKTRSFKYLLMFSLALALLASSAFGQVIEDDGVPLEVQPALNFTSGIACANGASSTDCQVDPAEGYMKEADWASGATYGFGFPYVDFAEVAQGAIWIDTNGNSLPEITCDMGVNTCQFDVDENGINDFAVTPNTVTFFAGLSTQVTYTTAGIPMMQGTGFGSRFSELFGLGRSAFYGVSSASAGNSSCLSRNNTLDLIHTDPDCDSVTVGGPEVAYGALSNSEAFLTDFQRRLAATFTTNGATDATGVQVTGLKLDLDYVGAYWIEYQILSQSSAVGNGLAYGVEYTGTETSLYCTRSFVSTGVTCPAVPACLLLPCPAIPACGATGITDDVAATNGGQLVEGYAANVASTVAPNLGPNTGVSAAGSTALETIRCNLLTTTAGDLTFYLASEANGTTVSVMANSMVKATAFP